MDPTPNKWVVALSVAFGSLMATIDSSIVNVAMPHIRGAVGASIAEITWVSSAYIISMVLVMPLTGLLGALFGQKRLYLGSLILFVVGSMLCGMASSLPVLILFRIVQGIAAGSLQPSQQAILRQTFPLEEQGMAMALFSAVIMIGPAIGPTLGGLLTDNFSWPWIFYINLPVGLIGIFMTWRNVIEPDDIREANEKKSKLLRKNIDWIGVFLLVFGVSSFQYLLEEGGSRDWLHSHFMVLGAISSIAALLFFVIRELHIPHPIIQFRLFQNRTYLSATLIGGLLFALLMGNMFLLPLYMQEILGFNATLSGLLLMPRSLAMIVVTPIVGKFYNQVSPAIIVAIGMVFFVIGNLFLSHLTMQSSFSHIIIPLLLNGVGLSCLLVPLTTTALSQISRHELSEAAGLSSFVRQTGSAFGLTFSATLLTQFSREAHSALSTHVTGLRPELWQQGGVHMREQLSRGVGMSRVPGVWVEGLAHQVHQQAMVLAFDKIFLLQGLIFLLALPLLFFLRVQPIASKEDVYVEI